MYSSLVISDFRVTCTPLHDGRHERSLAFRLSARDYNLYGQIWNSSTHAHVDILDSLVSGRTSSVGDPEYRK